PLRIPLPSLPLPAPAPPRLRMASPSVVRDHLRMAAMALAALARGGRGPARRGDWTGSTWAPNRISFSGNNRTHMVRVPGSDRFEVRVADGAVNPYLLPAVLLAAGLWGLDGKVSPKRFFFDPSVNMYAIPKGAPEISELPTMPQCLLDALRAMEADADLTGMLGAKFTESFQKLKKDEWSEYAHHLSAWELQNTLDC
ncbi:unnamed protein product, partial [Prorocentrum cordatum]